MPPCTSHSMSLTLSDHRLVGRAGGLITCIHAYMHTCIHAYMHTCIHAYMPRWPSRRPHYMHTCVHAHMHTCVHAHMHTCVYASLAEQEASSGPTTASRSCIHAYMPRWPSRRPHPAPPRRHVRAAQAASWLGSAATQEGRRQEGRRQGGGAAEAAARPTVRHTARRQ